MGISVLLSAAVFCMLVRLYWQDVVQDRKIVFLACLSLIMLNASGLVYATGWGENTVVAPTTTAAPTTSAAPCPFVSPGCSFPSYSSLSSSNPPPECLTTDPMTTHLSEGCYNVDCTPFNGTVTRQCTLSFAGTGNCTNGTFVEEGFIPG